MRPEVDEIAKLPPDHPQRVAFLRKEGHGLQDEQPDADPADAARLLAAMRAQRAAEAKGKAHPLPWLIVWKLAPRPNVQPRRTPQARPAVRKRTGCRRSASRGRRASPDGGDPEHLARAAA